MEKQFVVVICGPTASGKTALSVELAKELDAEIISADSMQIYKGMDIATAKPSISERDGIPHHLMDFLDPCEAFSVADYVRLAREKISDIAVRGRLPMIVGGTGLYISSLINNIQFEESECDYAYREQLRQLAAEKGNGYLMDMLKEIDPETAASLHENNQSRVIRALEVYKITGKTMSQTQRESRAEPSPYEPCMIALDYDRSQLYDRINKRVDIMLEEGLLEEARAFYSREDYPTAAQAIGYKELLPYLKGSEELDTCVERLKQETRKYAKRQLTWFRKDERIHWIKVTDNTDSREILEIAKKYIKMYGNFC